MSVQRSAFADHRREPLSTPARLAILLLILLAGAFLRFHHLTGYEPFIADEAAYHLEARYVLSLATHSVEVLRLKLQERNSGQDLITREEVRRRYTEELDGRPPWYARPLHIVFLALAMTLWSPEEVWLGGLVSAVFGTLSILLIYGLGVRLFGPTAGLLAAALFALCGYQVTYCHTGLTEQDSLFFLLLAGLLHVCGKDRPDSGRSVPAGERSLNGDEGRVEGRTAAGRRLGRGTFLFLTGLALGTCFATHYRMLTSILAFFFWEAFLQPWPGLDGRRERIRKRIACMGVLASGVALPIVLMEFPWYLLTLFYHRFLQSLPPWHTYGEQLLVQTLVSIHTNLLSTQKAFGLSNLLTYPYLLWKLSGPLLPAALCGALIFSYLRRSAADLWTLVLFFVPFFLSTLLQPRARYACSFLAFGSLLVASALCSPGGRLSGVSHLLRGMLIAALLVCGARYSWKAGESRMSYGHAMDFLRSQGTMKHLSTYPLVSQVYAGVEQVPSEWPPPSEEELRRIYEGGTRFLLVDAFKDLASFFLGQYALDTKPGFQERIRLLDRLEASLQPVFVTENLHLRPLRNIFEVNHNFLQTLAYYRRMAAIAGVRTIRIYDLQQLFGEAPGGQGGKEPDPSGDLTFPSLE